jgi:hypothetical protein
MSPTPVTPHQIKRWFYGESLAQFLEQAPETVLGYLTKESHSVESAQRNAWLEQVNILQNTLARYDANARIYFEYVIPRLGKRIDCVILLKQVLFVVEFKIGEREFSSSALDQVWDYAIDLRNFHETSHSIAIAPLLVATSAPLRNLQIMLDARDEQMLRPVCVSTTQFGSAIDACLAALPRETINVATWERGRYLPTPTIVEAAKALYAGHRVEDISRSDAGAKNLALTSAAIDRIIADTRGQGVKSICFVTGVPGAGKTLVGLDVATRHMDPDSALYSVFLSGNGPLVAVLREALTRDLVGRKKQEGDRIKKGEAKGKVSTFIQNVHHFRDDCLADVGPPAEHVALFDEAQRAWNRDQTSKFMISKKGRAGFTQSEPEFLISCLDRHADWAVVVCLVGGGQEINTGEAGITEWIDALCHTYTDWHVHVSPELAGTEFRAGEVLQRLRTRPRVCFDAALHLATSMRSFRAERLSEFVKQVLDQELEAARTTLNQFRSRYPIVLTRSVVHAKQWLREQARGSERYGLVVSSQAYRLKPHAIDVRATIDPVHWFLHDKDDTRSCYYLEDVATEFQVQGLELDWAGVVWDGDLRVNQAGWSHHSFVGARWQNIKAEDRKRHLENAYRVLLTRARQGMVIVVPNGDPMDSTRASELYDPTFHYLASLGIALLD